MTGGLGGPWSTQKKGVANSVTAAFNIAGHGSNTGFTRLQEPSAETGRPRWVPEETAGWLSRLFFSYCNGLIERGYAAPLEPEDLWDVAARDEAGAVSGRFKAAMAASADAEHPQGRVWTSMVAIMRRPFLVTAAIKVLHDLIMFASPALLQRLLHHMAAGGGRAGSFGLSCAILGVAVLENFTVNWYFHKLFRMSLHLKNALVDMLYDKSLRVTGAVKAEMGTGAIVNLQSNDAQKLWGLVLYLHVIWNGPFQILCIMFLLVRIMHWVPSMAGLAVTIVLIPMTTLLGKALAKSRREQIKFTDMRVKLCAEVITGVKAIKLYAWEGPYVERISALREKELVQIRWTQALSMFNVAMYMSGPVLVGLAAFGTYSAMGYTLTAAVAFPALALFNLLRFPIIMLPGQIMSIIQARVGLQRIQKFMGADEMSPTAPGYSRLPHPASSSALAGAGLAAAAAPVCVRGGTFAWEAGGSPVLHDVSLEVQRGELVMIVGQVGSGKSSLLAALLGEMHRVSGSVRLAGSVAYTAQDTWIQNSTLRANVLLGSEWEQDAYAATLQACALVSDLELLPAGDASEIGEKGINLSGGQKHRVALARATYAAADVYLLDDPLSAVDAHVGRHLFEECICGLLGDRTRLLVTHQLQHLEAADRVVVMEGGRVQHVGTYEELVARGVDFHKFVADEEEEAAKAKGNEEEKKKKPAEGVADKGGAAAANGAAPHSLRAVSIDGPVEGSASSPASPSAAAAVAVATAASPAHDDAASSSSPSPRKAPTLAATIAAAAAALDLPAGDGPARDGPALAPLATAAGPASAAGSTPATPTLPARFGGGSMGRLRSLPRAGSSMRRVQGQGQWLEGEEAAVIAEYAQERQQLLETMAKKEKDGKITKAEERAKGRVERSVYGAYLSAWSPFYLLPVTVIVGALAERGLQVLQNFVLSDWSNATAAAAEEHKRAHNGRYLSLYFTLGLVSIAIQLVRSSLLIYGSIRASRRLARALLSKVVRLPMSFFDSQPTGRLLNRFTKDMEALDTSVSSALNSALTTFATALLSVVTVAVVTPLALLAFLPLSVIYYRVQQRYVASSRELKRLDSLAMSPIFQTFGESLAGLATIRAFQRQDMFMERNRANLNASNRAYWPIQVVNRWLSVRLELMGAAVVFTAALTVAVIMPRNAGLAGLAITSALNLTTILNWMVRQTTELEVNMNSVERMVEYHRYDEEAPDVIAERRPPSDWPSQGAISVQNLTVRYRPELEPVLRGLSFEVAPREKVGVCGRTGCGKSTLMMALYRIVEPAGGRIAIDGLDIGSIGLRDLRSRLSLVPQDPVIFSGSVRSNLDPFSQADGDGAVWEALRRSGLEDTVRGLDKGLDSDIKEGGANLSVGQRQLLCMARALLRATRILVLDEATSNVDNSTDSVIQRTIRTAFKEATVLTIAHRLHTIVDSTRILLLEAGTLAEYDSPAALLRLPDSRFRGLVEESARGGGGGGGADVVAAALRAAQEAQ